MNNEKFVILFGGTGFIGRAVLKKCLDYNFKIIIPTRSKTIISAKGKLLAHGFNKERLDEFISCRKIIFCFDFDLSNSSLRYNNSWEIFLSKYNLRTEQISLIMNLSGDTSGSKKDIIKSCLYSIDSIISFVTYVKSLNKSCVFINLGSSAEDVKDKSPYVDSKIMAKNKLLISGVCNYYFIVGYVKGIGEIKMKKVAKRLLNKLRYSRNWLFGFYVSIIDVDDLADIILNTFFGKYFKKRDVCHEIFVTNGEIIFGNLILNLLSEKERVLPRQFIPKKIEYIFLCLYSKIMPILFVNSQLIYRLSGFAKRGARFIKSGGDYINNFPTSNDIISRFNGSMDYYITDVKNGDTVLFNKSLKNICILRKKTDLEIIKIIQKVF